MIEAEAVDAMVALPGQLFYGTPIPACIWILAKDKSNGVARDVRLRDRRGEVLFIDARKMGALIPGSRKQKALSRDEIARIAEAYHAWRGEPDAGAYADGPGFCKAAPMEEIARHNHVLTPGHYVGAGAAEEDGEAFEEKFERLMAELQMQFAEGAAVGGGDRGAVGDPRMSDGLTLSRLIEDGALSLQTGPFGSQLHSYDYQDQGVPVIPTEGIQGGRIDHAVLPKVTSD